MRIEDESAKLANDFLMKTADNTSNIDRLKWLASHGYKRSVCLTKLTDMIKLGESTEDEEAIDIAFRAAAAVVTTSVDKGEKQDSEMKWLVGE